MSEAKKKKRNGCDFSEEEIHSNNSPEKNWTQIKCKVDFTNHDHGFFFCLLQTILVCCSYFFRLCFFSSFVLLFTLSLHLIHSSVYHFMCVCVCVAVSSTHSLHCTNVVYSGKYESAVCTTTEDAAAEYSGC